MAKGKKLDLFVGADLGEGWGLVDEAVHAETAELLAPEKHQLVFKKEKRRGKPVTLSGPFALEKGDAEAVLKRIKQALGCGGTYKEGWMEFQGDIEAKLRVQLESQGFRLKRR